MQAAFHVVAVELPLRHDEIQGRDRVTIRVQDVDGPASGYLGDAVLGVHLALLVAMNVV